MSWAGIMSVLTVQSAIIRELRGQIESLVIRRKNNVVTDRLQLKRLVGDSLLILLLQLLLVLMLMLLILLKPVILLVLRPLRQTNFLEYSTCN